MASEGIPTVMMPMRMIHFTRRILAWNRRPDYCFLARVVNISAKGASPDPT